MPLDRIHTLADLQEEQMLLRVQIASSKKEFLRAAGDTASLGRKFLIHKVLITAGVAGLGIAGRKMISSASTSSHDNNNPSGWKKWLPQLLLTALPLALKFFSSRAQHEEEDDDYGYETASSASSNTSNGQWAAALVPLAVSLIQHLMEDDDEPDYN